MRFIIIQDGHELEYNYTTLLLPLKATDSAHQKFLKDRSSQENLNECPRCLSRLPQLFRCGIHLSMWSKLNYNNCRDISVLSPALYPSM